MKVVRFTKLAGLVIALAFVANANAEIATVHKSELASAILEKSWISRLRSP